MPATLTAHIQQPVASDPKATSSTLAADAVAELYDFGLRACRHGNRSVLRAVLADLQATFDKLFRTGSRQAVHEFCLHQSATGDLETISDLLEGLRDSWEPDVPVRHAA